MTTYYGKEFFSETSQFLKDSHFSKEDINVNINTGTQMFVEGKSAMFHGQPTDMQKLQDQMDAELIRIPYFHRLQIVLLCICSHP